ncbi:15-hydroxyprostaglandin dehydrogenase [NAD(+)]-like isoform X2 [Rhodnius prolixus]|uniref:15-hydroxyprostaglandin dehydrogenase [NAD(+)]-like isoform X2 n=1 Tax=Rhodnius prolixus TaxID=13249 RepID=UPI003D1898C7
MEELNGKVALVTGAAQGIGKSYVDHLLKHEVKVMISDVNKTVGEATREELATKHGEKNVKFVKCDVTSETEFEDAIKETIKVFGQLDILINNAGIAAEKDSALMININFNSVVNGTYLGMKYMGKDHGKHGGTVVNIASLTTFTPFECAPVYSATKSAVNQFSRSIGTKFHYDRTGVRVISINPGLTDTTILKSCVDNMPLEFKESFYTNVEKEYIQRLYRKN